MSDYVVETAPNPEELRNKVLMRLSNGYQPLGGVAISIDHDAGAPRHALGALAPRGKPPVSYAQAMVKP